MASLLKKKKFRPAFSRAFIIIFSCALSSLLIAAVTPDFGRIGKGPTPLIFKVKPTLNPIAKAMIDGLDIHIDMEDPRDISHGNAIESLRSINRENPKEAKDYARYSYMDGESPGSPTDGAISQTEMLLYLESTLRFSKNPSERARYLELRKAMDKACIASGLVDPCGDNSGLIRRTLETSIPIVAFACSPSLYGKTLAQALTEAYPKEKAFIDAAYKALQRLPYGLFGKNSGDSVTKEAIFKDYERDRVKLFQMISAISGNREKAFLINSLITDPSMIGFQTKVLTNSDYKLKDDRDASALVEEALAGERPQGECRHFVFLFMAFADLFQIDARVLCALSYGNDGRNFVFHEEIAVAETAGGGYADPLLIDSGKYDGGQSWLEKPHIVRYESRWHLIGAFAQSCAYGRIMGGRADINNAGDRVALSTYYERELDYFCIDPELAFWGIAQFIWAFGVSTIEPITLGFPGISLESFLDGAIKRLPKHWPLYESAVRYGIIDQTRALSLWNANQE